MSTGDRILRIAISGKSGCGNSTVSSLLAEELGVAPVNYTFRNLAHELGLSFEEVRERAQKSSQYDRAIDTRQVELAMQGPCVLGSRLAIWLLKEADLRVFLTASEEVRAKRIQRREGGSLSEIAAYTKKRDDADSARYKKLYNIDNSDYSFADLVIDTERHTPKQIVALIVAELRRRRLLANGGGA
jgi:cytidylate kinase